MNSNNNQSTDSLSTQQPENDESAQIPSSSSSSHRGENARVYNITNFNDQQLLELARSPDSDIMGLVDLLIYISLLRMKSRHLEARLTRAELQLESVKEELIDAEIAMVCWRQSYLELKEAVERTHDIIYTTADEDSSNEDSI